MWTLRDGPRALSLCVALCLPCCFGGQTGDPGGCAPPSAKPVLDEFVGTYTSPVVFSAPPDECPTSPEGTLHVDVISDIDLRGVFEVDCLELGWVAVLVRQSIDDEEPTTEPGWLKPNGLVVLVEGGGFPNSGAPERSLALDPGKRDVKLSSSNLSTIEDCCFESASDTCP